MSQLQAVLSYYSFPYSSVHASALPLQLLTTAVRTDPTLTLDSWLAGRFLSGFISAEICRAKSWMIWAPKRHNSPRLQMSSHSKQHLSCKTRNESQSSQCLLLCLVPAHAPHQPRSPEQCSERSQPKPSSNRSCFSLKQHQFLPSCG